MAGSNPWLQHVKKFWAANKGKMSYRQALVAAKKTYKKTATKAKKPAKKGKAKKKS